MEYEQMDLFCAVPRKRDDRKEREELKLENDGVVYVYDFQEQLKTDSIPARITIRATPKGEDESYKMEENRLGRWEELQKYYLNWINQHRDEYDTVSVEISYPTRSLLWYAAPTDWESKLK